MSKTKWEGYTLEELRCQRTLAQSRIMLAENRIDRDIASLQKTLAGGRPNIGHSVVGRMLGALSYLDWAIISISLFRKLAPLFSHKSRRG